MRTLRVLHLEDDAGDAERVRTTLEQENIDCTIDRVSSKDRFQDALKSSAYDLILSDYTATEFDGFRAFEMAKELTPEVPFLLLSDKPGENPTPLHPPRHTDTLKHRLQRLSFSVLRAHQEANERRERQANEDQIQHQAILLDHTRDAIFVRNLEQEITYWNKGAERMYGWTSQEILGKRASEILYKEGVPPRDNIWKIVLEKGEWMGELAQATKAGPGIYVCSRRTLLRDPDGNPNGVLTINTDITENRRMESELLRSQRLDSIGALAGGISHDLNNVLAPILMATELLEDKLVSPDDIAMLAILKGSAQRGIDLVKQILQFTQGTKGQGTTKVKSVIDDLASLIRKTFPRSLELEMHVPLDLAPISCNPTQFHQILLNLCVNARDAMPKGGSLIIRAANATLAGRIVLGQSEPISGSFVELAVTDTGTGIPREVLDRIFEPFFTTKPEGKGTGLGLSTVTSILRNIQGCLEVSTVVGKGTTFRVFLPTLDHARATGTSTEQVTVAFGRGEWILLVDDELALLEMTKELLEANGYQVIAAINAAEALLFFETNEKQISVVVADMIMPGIQGDELIAMIRQKSPQTITVSLSGSTLERPAHPEFSAHAFLRKPCSPKELIAVVQKLLSDRQSKCQPVAL